MVRQPELMIWWDGLDGADRHMADFHQSTRELILLRRRHPALRDEPIIVYSVDDRVLAFHRWVPGAGRDVVVVCSLYEHTFYDHSYRRGGGAAEQRLVRSFAEFAGTGRCRSCRRGRPADAGHAALGWKHPAGEHHPRVHP